MRATPYHSQPRHAFSLIELLAAIAVIAVLAAILIPIGMRVQERGKIVQRMNNMRSLASASLLYATDGDGSLPSLCNRTSMAWEYPLWYNQIDAYLPDTLVEVEFENGKTGLGKEVLMCPLVPDGRHRIAGQHYSSDYAGNSALFLTPAEAQLLGTPLKLTSIANPEDVVMVLSAVRPDTGNPVWYMNAKYYVNSPTGSSTQPGDQWTSNSFVPAVFADGHYEEIPIDDFRENRERYLLPENVDVDDIGG